MKLLGGSHQCKVSVVEMVGDSHSRGTGNADHSLREGVREG